MATVSFDVYRSGDLNALNVNPREINIRFYLDISDGPIIFAFMKKEESITVTRDKFLYLKRNNMLTVERNAKLYIMYETLLAKHWIDKLKVCPMVNYNRVNPADPFSDMEIRVSYLWK